MTPVLVYGSREFGHVVRELVADCGRPFAGFVDDWHSGEDVLGTLEEVRSQPSLADCDFVLAMGYNHLAERKELAQRIKEFGYRLARLIHPAAYVAKTAAICEGAMVMARATIDTRAVIRELAVIWPGAIVSHDSEVGSNTFVSPGATVCGLCRIGASSLIGAGAVVTDHVVVADGSLVKAGSLYTGGPLASWHPRPLETER